MKRRVFTTLSAVSLVLFVVAVVLWFVSYRFPPNRAGGDSLNFNDTDPRWWILSVRGRLILCRQNGREWGEEFPGFDFAGFAYGGLRGPAGSLYNLAIPHWSAAAVALALPLIWARSTLRHRRERRRARAGQCSQCGYDLRATPERCPECGAVEQRGPEKRLDEDQSVVF